MTISKIIRRLLAGAGILLLLLIAAALLIPVFFKDKLMAEAKIQLNKRLNATTDFRGISISLFRNFPQLSVGIEGLTIVNRAPFAGDTLLSAATLDISLDVMKAIHGSYDIRRINIAHPRIHALVLADGSANWNITIPDTAVAVSTAPAKPLALHLEQYGVEEGYVFYQDDTKQMRAEISGLNHSGSGDFTDALFTLKTETGIDALSFSYGNIAYLHDAKLTINTGIEVDNKTSKYSFNTSGIQLNGMKLDAKGFIQLPDTVNTVMDVQFSTPSNDFKDILSLVPGMYSDDFRNIKTTGKAALNGFVKGTYNTHQLPAYEVNLQVDDASFQYPSLPGAVTAINIKMKATNPDGVPDHTVVNISQAHLAFGKEPFDFRLLLKTPVSNAWVDAAAKGKIDLSQMQQFMKLEAGTRLTGLIDANVAVKGPVSAASGGKYADLDASGTIGVSNMLYAAKAYPEGVRINSLLLAFNPKNVTMSGLNAQYLGSTFTGNGSIDNLLGYYLHNDALDATVNIAADRIDANKFMGTTPDKTAAGAPAKPATASSAPFAVPSNLHVIINMQAGQVTYDKLMLTSVKGSLAVRDETVYLQNVTGNGLGGTLAISGSYSTKADKKNPDIALTYKLEGLDIQQTFSTFNTAQKLMPIAKYMAGKMTTDLVVKGKLGADMSPQMNTLTGAGSLLLIDGVLSKFAPVDQLAGKLNIAQLQHLSLQNLKTWFKIENGRISVDPFNVKAGPIGMEIAGSHGIDQTIDYAINLSVPRALVGSAGNQLVNNLTAQAAGHGIPVKVADVINFAVKIGGTITSPNISVNLKEVAGNAVSDIKNQVAAAAKARLDSTKRVVKDSVKAIKNTVLSSAKDELARQLSGKKDSANNGTKNVQQQVGDQVKGTLKNLFHK